MATREIEYAWLTSALRARDEFVGPEDSRGHPFLLRHGIAASTRQHRHITAGEEAEFVKTGGRHFYLAAVEADGRPLDLAEAYFLPSLLLGSMVVGQRLFQSLQEQYDLDIGYTLLIDPRFVSAHAWDYEFPSSPDDYRKIQFDMYEATGSRDEEDLGGDHELMRKLCERHPVSVDLPQMHLMLAPSLVKSTDITKAWDRDRIVITAGPKAMVRTRHGDVPATPDLFRTQPILKYEGFLIPPAAASLFNTGSDCGWPALTCIKNVTLRFEEDGQ